MTPSLSIVIPSHRRVDLLPLCLTSVERFAPAGTQVIVVDDGSANAGVSRAAEEFAGVEVVRLPKSQGFCTAANRGIATATGDVVEMLNDDAEVTPGWAEAALKWFRDDRIGAVAPLVLQNDGRQPPRIDTAGDEYHPGGYAIKRGHDRPWTRREFANAGPVWGVSAAAGFYRREVLTRAGGFPESFRAYFDDVDLSFRIRRLANVWYEPASVVWHRVSSSYGRKPSPRVLELQSRNEELVFWRNTCGRELWSHLPLHVSVLGAKCARRLTDGSLIPWSIGRLRAWKELLTSK